MHLSDLEICSRPSASLFAEHSPELSVQQGSDGAEGLGFRIWNSEFLQFGGSRCKPQDLGFAILLFKVGGWLLLLGI